MFIAFVFFSLCILLPVRCPYYFKQLTGIFSPNSECSIPYLFLAIKNSRNVYLQTISLKDVNNHNLGRSEGYVRYFSVVRI